jgi:hypothetical protein
MKQNEGAVHQRIRAWARRGDLIAWRRKGRWYFADCNNVLQSPEDGLGDEFAELWLEDQLAARSEEGGAQ